MFGCTKCKLHEFRKRQVVGRGWLPCDILFIGEAPGKSEDVRGLPFIGPSGITLNKGISNAVRQAHIKEAPRYYITNVIQCRPCDERGGPNREPELDEFLACRKNLEEIYVAANPKRIIFLGKIAQKFLKRIHPGCSTLQHPAYINRSGGIGSPAFVTFVRNLSTIFKEIENA